MPTRSLSRAALLTLFVVACSESPTRPVQDDAQFSFTNGPADLTNVARSPDGYQWVSFYDTESNLTLYATAFSPACGAYQDFLWTGVQDVGVLRDAVNTLSLGPIFLTIFDGDVALNPCAAEPLGEGVGQFMYLDNDKNGTATRNSTWSWRMTGQVQLADGPASLLALFRYTRKNGQTLEQAHFIRLTPH